MRVIVVEQAEFKRAFDECLLKIERALGENRHERVEDQFQTVNYHVRLMQARLEGRDA